MIKLRISRDDSKATHISYVCTTTGTGLFSLVFNQVGCGSVEIRNRISNWIQNHKLNSFMPACKFSEDLILAIKLKGVNKRVGTVIVSMAENGDCGISKVSFDDQIDQEQEYDLVLVDIAITAFDIKFI